MAKRLNKEAFEIIKTARAKGLDYVQIAKDLTAQGFKQKTGIPLTNSAVSNFAVANGLRTYKKRGSTKAPPSDVDFPESKDVEDFALDVLATNKISTKAKLAVIKSLLENT